MMSSPPPAKDPDDTLPPMLGPSPEPSTQQATRSGRPVQPPVKFDDFIFY